MVRSLPCGMRYPLPRGSITPTPYPGEFIPNGHRRCRPHRRCLAPDDLGRRPPRRAPRAQALPELPQRLDTRLLFPAARGGYLNLHAWRADEWTPAVKAAGLVHRSPCALRNSFATFAIAAGVPLYGLARFVGTSVEQIDRTYGHLLPDAVEYERGLLDAFDERANETYGHGSGTGE